MISPGGRRPSARTLMWSAIALSAAVLVVLLAAGWDDTTAWATAAGALVVACVAICIWAGAEGRRAERDIRLAVDRLAEARRLELHRHNSDEVTL